MSQVDSFHALRCRSQAKEDRDQKTMKANIYGLLFMLNVSEFSSTFLHSRLQSDDAPFPTQNSTRCGSRVRVKKKMKREGGGVGLFELWWRIYESSFA